MKVRFLTVALAELEEAVAHYNSESPGLGYEFADEIFRTIRRVQANPLAWQSLSRRTRRCLANRFPYGVVYQVREDVLLVVAIMHLHRYPAAWMVRLQQA
jgi:plasmid stabilization system protein ParE